MGDYTYSQIEILECPKPLRIPANHVLDRHEFQVLNNGKGQYGDVDFERKLEMLDEHPGGMFFTCEEMKVGTIDVMADELMALGPIKFMAWQDPCGEWLGDVAIHVPGYDPFTAECGMDGNPIVGLTNIMTQMKVASMTFEEATRSVLGVDIMCAYTNRPPLPPPVPPVTVEDAIVGLPKIVTQLGSFREPDEN